MSEARRTRQVNVRLPEMTVRRLKARCALEGISLAEMVERLVSGYLEGSVKLPPARPGKDAPSS